MVRQLARQLARRRRRERLAGGALAGLGVLVLVIALIAVRHPGTSAVRAGSATATPTRHGPAVASSTPSKTKSRSSSAPTTPKTTPTRTPTPTPTKLPLIVLNNTTITGLAAQAAQRFQAGGWTVTSYGNLRNEIISTCAYYDPSVPNAQASALALQRQFPTIKRVVPKFPELPAGPIVVVLTPDYS